MGKIRVKTIGDESQEAESREARSRSARQKKARKESESKEVEGMRESNAEDPEVKDRRIPSVAAEDVKAQTKPETEEVKSADTKEAKSIEDTERSRSTKRQYKRKAGRSPKKYAKAKETVEQTKKYSLKDALTLLPQLSATKFDETVELHINTLLTGVSGNVTLPHGTGKKVRVAIANPSDTKALDALVATIESGKIEFDILLATPDAMPKLARVAKFLGPRGLMPNPKNGTVSQDPEKIAKQYEGGQINFKTELKAPIMHLTVGKVSFGEDKLAENIKTLIEAIQTERIKDVTLKSTMSPGIKLNITSL
ncbi:MAG TPA: hypothetical protein VJC10_03370 [Patescibacteria group bacterium]|nr:hypothetical protein [Patescibacteria group bacterium]